MQKPDATCQSTLPRDVTLAVLKQALRESGRLSLKPMGGSMGPRFARADSLTILPMPTHRLPVGTVLVFARGNGWIAHRILRRVGDRYVTGGDGAALPDADIALHAGAIGYVASVSSSAGKCDLTTSVARTRARFQAWRSIAAALLRHPRGALARLSCKAPTSQRRSD